MEPIKDINLEDDITVKNLINQFSNTGFQAHNIASASKIFGMMLDDPDCSMAISFPCNLIASGLRGIFIDLIKNGMISTIFTSSGSVEEDFIRADKPYLQGKFEADDEVLAKKGINRMGNIFVPNDRYEHLEKKMPKILAHVFKEKKVMTPSELIHLVGKHSPENTLIHQAYKSKVPIFCPGITDGAFGMQLFLFQQKHPEFMIDPVRDLRISISRAFDSKKLGIICLGGGISKHHAILSALMRGGYDYAIYINSSSPYRGSLSGATTQESISWGKVKKDNIITVHGDAQIVFPLLAASIIKNKPKSK